MTEEQHYLVQSVPTNTGKLKKTTKPESNIIRCLSIFIYTNKHKTVLLFIQIHLARD